MTDQLHMGAAFAAGVASFVSPCCLPLYPSFISYITGLSLNTLKNELNEQDNRKKVMMHTAVFIAGFSVVFYSLGYGAGAVGVLFQDNRVWLRQISGVLMIIMGLFLSGLIQPTLLLKEWKPGWGRRSAAGYLGSFLLGIGFAAGWSPCVGPILAGVIALAASEPGAWMKLITAYTAGFAVPFFVFAFYVGSVKTLNRYSGWVMKVGGAVMVVMGLLLFTGRLTGITIWLQRITPDFLIF
ncbi:cytochrome c biogenesis CcdA family protein [Paenibacillus physcomitrellae]|uniref:Cytochrome C biogenesis protein CcdA n=2 Tax=Paenibacillus physcomitrellae TaxID=1619311 RepID=A0ABQ1FNY5_9BACL|nr:cytochrome c biogenesis protein CcdA [Paenibacillus physcomitrellae]GGA22248.1 cytochrome C biogenesis protein CcdA [Paenibacillus physcomitrellae]